MNMKMPATPIWPTQSLKLRSHCWTGRNLIARKSAMTIAMSVISRPIAFFVLCLSLVISRVPLEVCSFARAVVEPGENLFRARSQARLVVFVARFARELGERRVGVNYRGNFAEADLRAHGQHKLGQKIARVWSNDG